MIRILSWNIRHGGKSKSTDILNAIIAHAPDVVLLCEYRLSSNAICEGLYLAGFIYVHITNIPEHKNGLLVASRHPVSFHAIPGMPPNLSHLWIEVIVGDSNTKLLYVHIPSAGTTARSPQTESKRQFWSGLLEYAKELVGDQVLIVGDFNTGFKFDAQGTPFMLGEKMMELCEAGWMDIWRYCHPGEQDYTWYSKRRNGDLNGFRLDHAFVSPSLLESIQRVEYSHAERLMGLSDHSMLLVDIRVSP